MAEPTWIDRIYTHFVGRDLTYLAAGTLMIAVEQWAWLGDITFLDTFTPQLLAYLVLAYFLGLGASELLSVLWVAPKQIDKKAGPSRFSVVYKLTQRNALGLLQEHERTLTLLHAGSAVAAGSFGSLAILGTRALCGGDFPSSPNAARLALGLAASFAAGVAYTWWEFHKVLKQREELLKVTDESGSA